MYMLSLITALALFVLTPVVLGYLFRKSLLGKQSSRSYATVIAESFAIGFCIVAWLSLLGYALRLQLFWLGGLIILTAAILATTAILRRGRVNSPLGGNSYIFVVVLVCALILAFAYFFIGPYQDPSADTARHLAFIMRLAESGVLSDEVFRLSSLVPDNGLTANYGYNCTYPIFALLAKTFSLNSAEFYLRLPAFITPILLFTFYAFYRRFIGSHAAAITAVAALLTLWAGGANSLRQIGYPYLFGLILYYTLLSISMRSLNDENNRLSIGKSVLLGALAAALLVIHNQWWAFYIGTLGLLLIFQIIRKKWQSALPLLVTVGSVTAFSVVPLLMRLSFLRGMTGELISERLAGLGYRIYHLGSLYAFNPFTSFPGLSPLYISTAFSVALVAVFKGVRKMPVSISFPAFVVIVTFLILICPLTVTLISTYGTPTLAKRLLQIPEFWGFILTIAVLYHSSKQLLAARREQVEQSNVIGLAGTFLYSTGTLFFLPLVAMFRPLHQMLVWTGAVSAVLITFIFLLFEKRMIRALSGAVEQITQLLIRLNKGLFRPHNQLGKHLLILFFMAYPLGLLLLPQSHLSFRWNENLDEFVGQRYGPTIEQTLASEKMFRVFRLTEDKAVVVTDNWDFLLAYDDVLVPGDVNNEIRKDINNNISTILNYKTQPVQAMRLLKKLSADYVLLAPPSSHIGWKRFDSYPSVFQLLFREKIDGIDYSNNVFALYKIDKQALDNVLLREEALAAPRQGETAPYEGPIRKLEPRYTLDLRPSYPEKPSGRELTDGSWNSTSDSLTWVPMVRTWSHVEFDLGDDYALDRVVILNTHLTTKHQMGGLALFAEIAGGRFKELGQIIMDKPSAPGEHAWQFECAGFRTRRIRVAFGLWGTTTIGEIEIYARGPQGAQAGVLECH